MSKWPESATLNVSIEDVGVTNSCGTITQRASVPTTQPVGVKGLRAALAEWRKPQ